MNKLHEEFDTGDGLRSSNPDLALCLMKYQRLIVRVTTCPPFLGRLIEVFEPGEG